MIGSRVTIDGKGDGEGVIVAFTGGDYNQWAIVQWGIRFTAEPLHDLRVVLEELEPTELITYDWETEGFGGT